MRWAVLALLSLLTISSHAEAKGHRGGQQTGVLYTTFGAKTLAGYGGYVIPGLSGTYSISNQKDASGTLVNVFTHDEDFDGTNSQIVLTGTYAGAPTTAPNNGPYSMTVTGTPTDGGPAARTLVIGIVPNQWTVKSQYLFNTHGDTGSFTGFQLGKILNISGVSGVNCGDTIVMRNGSGESGITPALNPKGLSNLGYDIEPPAGGWTCASGRITITSESQGVVLAPDGFYAGGGAQIGPITISNQLQSSTPYADPLDFSYVTFYANHNPGPDGVQPTQYLLQGAKGSGSDAKGWGCHFCYFATGPNLPNAAGNIFQIFAVLCTGCTIDHSYFNGSWFGANAIGPVVNATLPAPSIDTSVVSTYKYNDYQGLGDDWIDIQINASNPDVEFNFGCCGNENTANPIPGDYFVINGAVYTFVAAYVNTQGSIPINASPAQTVQNAVCTINAGGSGCVAGVNYPAVETPDTNVSAVISDAFPNIFANLTALVTGTGGNSITLNTGNTTFNTCKFAIAGCGISGPRAYGSSNALVSASTLTGGSGGVAATGFFEFQSDHSDTVQWDQTSTTTTTTSGTFATTTFTDNVAGHTWQSGEFLTDAGVNLTGGPQIVASDPGLPSCTGGCQITVSQSSFTEAVNGILVPIRPGGIDSFNIAVRGIAPPNSNYQQFLFGQQNICCVTALVSKNNISNLGASDIFYLQQFNNPTVNFNTALTDVESNAYAPLDPTYDLIANRAWSATFGSAYLSAIAPSGGGGWTVTDNLVNNFYAGQLTNVQTASAVAAPWSLSSGTLVNTPSWQESIGAIGGTWTYTPVPTDGTTVFSSYATFLPNYQSGDQHTWSTPIANCPARTGICNRQAAIKAFAPSIGTTVSVTFVNASTSATLVSGSLPQFAPLNCQSADAASGIVPVVVSGSAITLNVKATGSGTVTCGTGAMNADGTYNGALFPPDNAGVISWNDGTVFNPASTHTPAY